MATRLLNLFGIKLKGSVNTGSNPTSPKFRTITLDSFGGMFGTEDNWNYVIDDPEGTGYRTPKAMRLAAVFACVERKSIDIAKLPLRPMHAIGNGSEIARDYDQYFISYAPSYKWTKYTWQKVLNAHIDLYGDCFSPIKRKNGRPVEYGIWHPLDVIHEWKGTKLYWVNQKTKEVLNDEDMIHVMDYSENGIRGRSKLSLSSEMINLGLNARKMASTQYKNMNWQSGYISYKQPLSSEVADLISQRWKINTTGEANINEVPLLDNGSEWKNFGGTLKEAEIVALMSMNDEQIARLFGVPPSKIGIRNANVSYNSLEQENIAYVQDSLMPRCVAWEEELNRKSISEADLEIYWFKFNLNAMLRGDTAARSTLYRDMINMGVFTPNDVLSLEDMNTGGPECDERYVNAAMVTLKSVFEGKNQQNNAADTQKLFDQYIKSLSKNGNGATHNEVLQH